MTVTRSITFGTSRAHTTAAWVIISTIPGIVVPDTGGSGTGTGEQIHGSRE